MSSWKEKTYHKNNIHYFFVFLISTAAHAETKALGITLKGPSTKEYVDRTIAVIQTQNTLRTISDLHDTVKNTETDISSKIEKDKQILEKKLSLLDLKKEIMKNEIQHQMNLSAQAQEGDSYDKLNRLNYLRELLSGLKQNTSTPNWSQKKQAAEQEIAQLVTKLDNLYAGISKAQELIKNPEKSAQMEKILSDMKELQDEVLEATHLAKAARDERIFEPHNDHADTLMGELKTHILRAKCTGITHMGSASNSSLEACKMKYLSKIKEAQKSIPTCATLPDAPSIEDLQACKSHL